jgi:hypothetical protein
MCGEPGLSERIRILHVDCRMPIEFAIDLQRLESGLRSPFQIDPFRQVCILECKLFQLELTTLLQLPSVGSDHATVSFMSSVQPRLPLKLDLLDFS